MNNYRLIALVPLLSKIFESLLNRQIMDYFESASLFYQGQFGFRRGRGVSDAILHLLDKITSAMEESDIIGSNFFDLIKAFVC